MLLSTRTLVAATLAGLAVFAAAQKKPLDHSVYDSWKSVQGTQLSDDGRWILYRIAPQEGDAIVEIKSTSGNTKYTIERGSTVQFSRDGKYVIATVVPTFIESRDARRKKVKPEDQPKNSLVILDLATGEQTKLDRVTSFTIADDDTGWIVYRPEPPKPTPPTPGAAPATPTAPKPEEKKDEVKKKAEHRPGETVVLRNLAIGKEERLENVAQYRFSEDGRVLVYSLSTKDGAEDGIVWYDLTTGNKTAVVKQLGRYRFSLDKKATKLAYVTDKDDYAAKKPGQSIYLYSGGKSTLLAKEGTPGIPNGWWIAENTQLTFSENGNRLVFSTQPKPAEEKPDTTPEEEKVSVDIWHWQDPTLQPQQLLGATAERNRSYTALIDLRNNNKVVQLATPEMQSVQLGTKLEAPVGLGSTNNPYRIEQSWDTGYSDYYLIDLSTGKATKVLSKFEGFASLSPTGKYAYAYDQVARKGLVIDTRSGAVTDVTKDIPYPVWDELTDVPGTPGSYGTAGWLKNDERLFVYDNFDIWSVDPTGKAKPFNVTNGFGRSMNTTLRYVRTDPEAIDIDPNQPMLLRAMNESTKATGFYTDMPTGNTYPTKVLMEDRLYSAPTKAKDGNTIYFTRMTITDYPDVWIADDLSFSNQRKMSEANPQQKEYNWATSELIQYTSNDGLPLQGILIKPENFDYGKKYPMIVYFYERSSDTLHNYRSPAPSASVINQIVAASQGYLVLIPDIAYKEGYPGESAMSCVMPAVQEVLRRGYVDPKKIGLDGQSWGGYQIAYMVTETDMFACGFAGAPVANMFSAYGGIRWGSGLVRAFQYEKGQSRIAGSVWDKPIRFLENSPLFFLDKVKTPLLIMANDKDGAVPWYQGIELFTGLRRLQKPAWLLVYNNEDHNLVERKNRKDLSIRKHQFFDHYLKGAPMPEWMAKGIPATEKGKNYGLEVPKG